MLKPQEVSSVVFEKAVFGGYDISSVDKFLSQITKDYSALCRDNELLQNRLSAMAEKIEEYRANEDAMRLALLSAKKTAKELEEKNEEYRTNEDAMRLALLSAKKAAKELEEKNGAGPEAKDPNAAAELDAAAAELEKEKAILRRAKELTASYLLRFREATSTCEAALIDLYEETVPGDTPDEGRAGRAEKAKGPGAAELDFAELNFGQN